MQIIYGIKNRKKKPNRVISVYVSVVNIRSSSLTQEAKYIVETAED